MLLVVVHHVVRQMTSVAPGSWQVAATAWTTVDVFLTPVRIPLFFFISGFLVSRRLGSGLWRERRPWVLPAYLYVLWSTLLTLRLLIPGGDSEHSFASNLVGNLVLAGSGYWYIYALPLYYIYAHATHRLPGWLVALPLVAGLLARPLVTSWAEQLASTTMDSASLLSSILANGIFFWLGARYGKFILGRLSSAGYAATLLTLAAFTSLQVSAMVLDVEDQILPIMSFLGIAVGALLASRSSQDAAVSRGLRYIGRRTLPVYVLQFFFISALSLAWGKIAVLPLVDQASPVAWVYPVVVTAVATACALAFFEFARGRRILSWLFSPPDTLTGRAAVRHGPADALGERQP